MGDIKSEQFHNDFEIEISNLDKPEISPNLSRLLPSFRKPRFSPRRRRFYLIFLNGLVLLGVVLLLVTRASVRDLVEQCLHPPDSESDRNSGSRC